MDITVGCDPELFVTKDGKFRSAHGLVPGTKKEPFKVINGAVQVDGMALEYNIDPVDNADDFVGFNQSVLKQLKDMIPVGYEFAVVPSCKFNGNHFRAQPDEAKELGCEPDYNAYTGETNPRPDNTTTMRTASGHIHIGFCEESDPYGDAHMTRCATLVKQLDCYLGLPSLLFDGDVKRRKMYGAAGAFRPKPYGVEYRVLSNAWLLNEDRMRFVFSQTVNAVNDLVKGVRVYDSVGEWNLQDAINRSDVFTAGLYIRSQLPNGADIALKAANI